MAGFETSGHVNRHTKVPLQTCLPCTRAALA